MNRDQPTTKTALVLGSLSDFDGVVDSSSHRQLRLLGPISRVNLLIGANNSGKSRLLRALLKNNLPSLSASFIADIDRIHSTLAPFANDGGGIARDNGTKTAFTEREVQKILELAQDYDSGTWLVAANFAEQIRKGRTWRNSHTGEELSLIGSLLTHSYEIFSRKIQSDICEKSARDLFETIEGLTSYQLQSERVQKVWIPIHRTLTTLWGEGGKREDRDIFLTTAEINYDLKVAGPLSAFTGLQFYKSVQAARLGNRSERESFSNFEKFLSMHFFSGERVDIVARIADEHVTVLIGDDGIEREVHNLGDGIGAAILLLYPIFTAPTGSWIFIEEPETHLHPGFEGLLLKVLLEDPHIAAQKLTFFLATHSNHLLGGGALASRDVSIFSLQKRHEAFSLQRVSQSSVALLDELGVENGSVLLSNCSIWVEGPSDRIIIRAYLNAYLREHSKDFLEGLHYSFFLYGGALIAHYVDPGTPSSDRPISLGAIANRCLLICDLDKDEKKHARHDVLRSQESPGFRFLTTEPAIEIENTISKELLLKLLPQLHPRKARDVSWIQSIDEGVLESTHPGALCAESGTAFAIEPSGTLTAADKMSLARLIRSMKPEWAQLSSVAQKLTTEVFQFIDRNNSSSWTKSGGEA